MAIVSCPECSKKLKVADASVGKKVKCSCGNVFVAESGNGAPAKAAAAAPDKVMVACTECGAKLKVGSASLGKKMKCPKCAGVFVAAAEQEAAPAPAKKPARPAPKPEPDDDDVDPPAPVKKAKAVSDDDMDDLFSFAQKDAAGKTDTQNDEPSLDDDDDAPKPKGKAKSKKPDPDDNFEEDDFPKPKSKFGANKAKPAQLDKDDEEDDDKKPVYPKRTFLNLFVLFLLAVFVGAFGLLFFAGDQLGLPKPKPFAKGKKGVETDEQKKQKKAEEDRAAENKKEAAKFDGVWFVDSAEVDGKPILREIGKKYTFADGKLTAPKVDAAPFQLDAGKEPKEIDIIGPKFPVQGIYKFAGDSLLICIGKPMEKGPPGVELPGKRPDQFDSKEASLVVLKRERRKDEDAGAMRDAAAAQINVLTKAAQAYKVKNADFPDALADLLQKDATGSGPYLESKDALIDPWKQPYQYDTAGTKNGGLNPDIWTVTPDKQIIGNWPKEKAKDKGPKGDAKLSGAWVVESAMANGQADDKTKGEILEFTDGNVFGMGPAAVPYAVNLAKDPSWLDLTYTVAPGKTVTMAGLYKFDGEKLHVCFPAGKDPTTRPASFDAKDVFVAVLRRATKDDSRYSRNQSAKNLKQIGLAIHNFHDQNNRLPPAASSGKDDATGKPLLSWRVAILPYLDQAELYKEFDQDKAWDDPHNMKLIAKMPKVYMVPGVDAKEGMTHYRALVGPGTLLDPIKDKDGKLIAKYKLFNIPDGSSNVIMVVEAKEPAIWTKPDDLPYDPKGPLPKFGVVPVGFNALFGDASVRFVSSKVPEKVLRPYFTCANGIVREPLDPDKKIDKGKDEPKSVGPSYAVPKGWERTKPNELTHAAFAVEDKDRKVAATMTVLTGKGGGLLANANRWRAQLKLPAWSEEELAKAATKRTVDGFEGVYLELTEDKSGQPASILAVIVFVEQEAWFFKLAGDAQLASREKANFLKLVDSVKFK